MLANNERKHFMPHRKYRAEVIMRDKWINMHEGYSTVPWETIPLVLSGWHLKKCCSHENVPVFVESSLTFFSQMLSPDSLESTKTSWGFNVSNNTDGNHGWCFDDGYSLNDFFLVQFGTRTISFTYNMGHTSLESKEGSQVRLLGSIVLWERLYLSTVTCSTSFGQESHGPVTRGRKLSMRLDKNRI